MGKLVVEVRVSKTRTSLCVGFRFPRKNLMFIVVTADFQREHLFSAAASSALDWELGEGVFALRCKGARTICWILKGNFCGGLKFAVVGAGWFDQPFLVPTMCKVLWLKWQRKGSLQVRPRLA